MRHRKRKELRFDRKHRKHINLKWIPEVFGWVFQIVLVCLCAFVFVWYFGHQISNIGESMNPVIRNGDVVLVNRIVYDASTPKRGDIIVFKGLSDFRAKVLRSGMERFISTTES